jgi:hypothetical protein
MVSYLLMAIGTVIVTVSVAATSGTRPAWISHPITAIPGLLLLVIIILTVAKQGGASYGGPVPGVSAPPFSQYLVQHRGDGNLHPRVTGHPSSW